MGLIFSSMTASNAETLFSDEQFQESIDEYKYLLSSCPNNPCYLGNIAAAYANLKEYGKAFECIEGIISQNQNFSPAFRIRGSIKFHQGLFREAIKDFESCIRLEDKAHQEETVNSYVLIALSYYFLNEIELAKTNIDLADKTLKLIKEQAKKPISTIKDLDVKTYFNPTYALINNHSADYNDSTKPINIRERSLQSLASRRYKDIIKSYHSRPPRKILGIEYWILGEANFHLPNYAEALINYAAAINNKFNSPRLASRLNILLESMTKDNGAFELRIAGETLLHFLISQNETYVSFALRLIYNATNTSRLDYLQILNSKGQTALANAVEKEYFYLFSPLLKPFIKMKLELPLMVSNESLLQGVQGFEAQNTSQGNEKFEEKVNTQAVAELYVQNGLTEENFQEVETLFSPDRFNKEMVNYNKNNANCEHTTRMILAKFVHDNSSENVYPMDEKQTSIFEGDATKKVKFIVNLLRSMLNYGVGKKIHGDFSYFNQFFSILDYIGEVGAISNEDIIKRIDGLKVNETSFLFLVSVGLELYRAIQEKRYDHIFRLIAMMIRFLTNYFGVEESLSPHIIAFAKDLSNDGDSDQSFFRNIHQLYGAADNPAIRNAAKILNCNNAISKSINFATNSADKGMFDEAKMELTDLISNITIIIRSYPNEQHGVVKATVKKIIRSDDIKSLVKIQNKYNQYDSIIKILIQLEKALPSKLLKDTIDQLSQMVETFNEGDSNNKILIFLKAFSRLLIGYGNHKKNELYIYTGFICLGITQSISAFNVIKKEPSTLGKAKTFSQELSAYLVDITTVNQSKNIAIAKVATFSIAFNLFIRVTYELHSSSDKLDVSIFLKTLSKEAYAAKQEITLILQKIPESNNNDPVLGNIQLGLDILIACILAGNLAYSVYNLFNGNAIRSLQQNLYHYLPSEAAPLVEGAVNLALSGVPVIGSVLSSQQLSVEIGQVGKAIETRIDQMEQHFSLQLRMFKQDLSQQLTIGLSSINYQLKEINPKLDHITLHLKRIEKLTVELAIIRKIKDFNANIERKIRALENKVIGLIGSNDTVTFYELFLQYLSAGGDNQVTSVYNKNIRDCLFTLHQEAIQERGFKQKKRKMPIQHVELWMETITTFILFLSKADINVLINYRFFDFQQLDNLFNEAVYIFQLLKFLNSKQLQESMLDKLTASNVDPEVRDVVVCYSNLAGIPLLGYGESINDWLMPQEKNRVFRQAVVKILLESSDARKTKNLIQETEEACGRIITTFGLAIIKLVNFAKEEHIHQNINTIQLLNKLENNAFEKLRKLFAPRKSIDELYSALQGEGINSQEDQNILIASLEKIDTEDKEVITLPVPAFKRSYTSCNKSLFFAGTAIAAVAVTAFACMENETYKEQLTKFFHFS